MTQANEKPLIIMDGGMGRELEQIGAPFKQPEWSALALIEAPEMVIKAHNNFISAGAEIIITNAYAVVPFHIGQERFDSNAPRLIELAATIARDCADKAPHKVIVAGSIPPLYGSYNPDAFNEAHALEILTPLIERQQDHVDVWIMETVSSLQEGTMVAKHLAKTGKPIWVSFTLTDREDENEEPTIRSENTAENAVKAAMSWDNVEAILFNCSQPVEMEAALKIAKPLIPNHFHLGVYANTFKNKTKKGHLANQVITRLNEDFTPDDYTELAKQWRALGANIIGGCCGIGPQFIKHLKENLS